MNQQHQADDNFEGGDQGREATGQREPTSQASGTQQETREANLPSRAAVVHQHLRLEGQKSSQETPWRCYGQPLRRGFR